MGNQSGEGPMASPEVGGEGGAGTTAAQVVLKYGGGSGTVSKTSREGDRKVKLRRRMRMPDLRVFPCMRVEEEEEGGGFDVVESGQVAKENGVEAPEQQPSHLVITVNGLLGRSFFFPLLCFHFVYYCSGSG